MNLINSRTIDSREVSEMTGKRHDHLIRDIENYIQALDSSETPTLGSQNFFIPSTYTVESNNKTYPCYLLTRKGCDMVANKMTGEKGILFTAAYVTKFEEMEKGLNHLDIEKLLINPDTIIKLAQNWKEEREKRIQLEEKVLKDRPKVLFADSVAVSDSTILIRELSKLLKQNGVEIGEKRLYEKLRKEGYLVSRGSDRNSPTQRSMELELFTIKETAITHSDGHVTISKTTKVTGNGQQYFINRFLKETTKAMATSL